MVKQSERITSALWDIRAVQFCPSPQIPIPLEREEVGRVAAWLWIYSICASQFSWAIQPPLYTLNTTTMNVNPNERESQSQNRLLLRHLQMGGRCKWRIPLANQR